MYCSSHVQIWEFGSVPRDAVETLTTVCGNRGWPWLARNSWEPVEFRGRLKFLDESQKDCGVSQPKILCSKLILNFGKRGKTWESVEFAAVSVSSEWKDGDCRGISMESSEDCERNEKGEGWT